MDEVHEVTAAVDCCPPRSVQMAASLSHPSAQGGLADEQAGERAGGVHVVVGQHADRFELGVIEQVGLVDHEDGSAAAFDLPGRERVDGRSRGPAREDGIVPGHS